MLLDLRRQLSRWRNHECARATARARHEPVKNGQEERRGLPAPRHRAREDVAALDRRGNGVGLNGCGASESELLHTAEEIGMQTARRERHDAWDGVSAAQATRARPALQI